VRSHGQHAVAHLTSPAADELPERLRLALTSAVAASDFAAETEAFRAARDCVARLRIRALDLESQDLTKRLESCNDTAQLETLLARKQQNMRERDELWRGVQQV
jgi:hypothetical protein